MKKSNDKKDQLRARISKVTTKPGVYRWLDKDGELLYVGKAKNLRNRMRSYFLKDAKLGPWKTMMVRQIEDFDYTITANELEALILETNLIKENRPKYNVMMKDDKNYVYVRISDEAYPRVEVVRQMDNNGSTYFGPYLSARSTRHNLEMLHDIYPYKACKESLETLNRRALKSEDPGAPIRPNGCLEYQIGNCCGLCKNTIPHEAYRERIDEVIRFFRRDRRHIVEKIKAMMQIAAEEKKFEKAAKMRDTLQYLLAMEEQQVVSGTSGDDTDAFGVALQADKAHVVILRERNGKIIEEMSYALKGQPESVAEVLEQFLPQYYSDTVDIPDLILVAEQLEDEDTLEQWLNTRRGTNRKVSISTPQRGKKSKLLDMAENNAMEKIQKQYAKWEAATKNIETALTEIKTTLQLNEKPKRIECYDISHLDGTETVGSMVVAIDGKPKNDQYRSFTIRTMKKGEIDDYKALKEVLQRRLRHLVQNLKEEEGRWKTEGITFGKARKKEHQIIEEHLEYEAEDMALGTTQKGDFIVARNKDEIIGFGCLIESAKGIIEMKSLWVHEKYRNKNIGQFLVRKLLSKVTTGKVYITIQSKLEEYYARLGFRYVQDPPTAIGEIMEQESLSDPDFSCDMVMVYIVADNKADSSLSSKPDLLILDGGKGQLSAGVEVLKKMGVEIPIASIAKREEEIFIPGSPNPVSIKKDSEGSFMIMRLRDEAHRFANRHREKRAKNALLGP